MSEQVKRYKISTDLRPEAIAFLPDEVVSGRDYDALHAEAEALRAENERLNREADESLAALVNQRDAARTQLEAARGLLQTMRRHTDEPNGYKYPVSMWFPQIDAFLTATPAPEVRCQTCDGTGDVHRADGEWLGECHCAKAELGERQQAFIYALMRDGDTVVLDWASDEEVAKGWVSKGYHYLPLYTTPQPGPDVRGLVEAAQAFADAARPNIYPCPDKPHSLSGKLQALDAQLAAYHHPGEPKS